MTPTRRTWALSALALALTLFLGACSTAPKNAAAPTLEPQFGGEYDDFGIDVAVSSKGYIYGISQRELYESTYYEEYDEYDDYGEIDLNLERYDSSGKLVWSKRIEYEYYDGYYSCSCSNTGPISVFADAKGYAYVLFSQDQDYYGPAGFYVSKFDASGRLIKKVWLGEGDSYSGAAATVDTSGNLYIGKTTRDYNYQTDTSKYTGFVAKYSAAGSLLWQRTATVGLPKSVGLASNGSLLVAGTTGVSRMTSSGNVTWTKSGEAFEAATSGTNVYLRNYKTPTVRKLDANGKQLWSKTQTGLSNIVIGAMTADASGNVYLTGKYNASSGNRDIFTRKLNSSGGVVWTKTFGTSAYDDARGIATVNGSEVYITGSTQGALAHSFRGGENDGYIAKLNSGGNPVWKR